MKTRRHTLGLFAATFSAVAVSGPERIINSFVPRKKLILQTVTGPVELDLGASRGSIVETVEAQSYYINDPYQLNYSLMIAHQQMMAAAQAQQAWINYLAQQQAAYDWMTSQYLNGVDAMFQQFSNSFPRVGDPEIWEKPESVYAMATDVQGLEGLIGVNAVGHPVKAHYTLPAANKVWNWASENIYQDDSKKKREKKLELAIGPQTTESLAKIKLPDNSVIDGTAYSTTDGFVGLSSQKIPVDGELKQIAKFKIGDDGEKYMVI